MEKIIGRKIVEVMDGGREFVDQFGTKHVVVEFLKLDDGTMVHLFPVVSADGKEVAVAVAARKREPAKNTIRVTDKAVDTKGFLLQTYEAPYRCIHISSNPKLHVDAELSYTDACKFLGERGYRCVSEMVGTGWGASRSRWVKGDFIYCALAADFGPRRFGNDFTLFGNKKCLIEDDGAESECSLFLNFEEGCQALRRRGFSVEEKGKTAGVDWVRLTRRKVVDISMSEGAPRKHELRSDERYLVLANLPGDGRRGEHRVDYWQACELLERNGWVCTAAEAPLHLKDDSQWIHVREQFTSSWSASPGTKDSSPTPPDWRNREEAWQD